MSDSSSSIPVGMLGEESSVSSVAGNRFEDAEAEECEEEESLKDDKLSDSENEPMQEDTSAKRKLEGTGTGANKRRRIIQDDTDVVKQSNKSFVSETGDDGFAAMADEFATFETPPSRAAATPKRAEAAAAAAATGGAPTDPALPTDPATLDRERNALEGPGTGQIRLELRSLEAAGMKLLKTSKESHEFLVFIRKLLHKHNAHHVRACLLAEVDGRARGEFLFDRLRRRYWARLRGVAEDVSNKPLPLVQGKVTVQVPLEPSEVSLVGEDLPPAFADTIGNRAAGSVVEQHQITAEGKVAGGKYVIITSEAQHIFSADVAAGGYGSCSATVSADAALVPMREGGTVAGVVTFIQKPQFELNRCISLPTKPGFAKVRVAPKRSVVVQFGAEVPPRSVAVGRTWVLQLGKEKGGAWRLHFAMDPFLTGEAGDTADLEAIPAAQVGAMNRNRRPCVVQPSSAWAAADDLKTGWRVVKQLPEEGYWQPRSLREMYGTQYVRGVEIEVSSKRFIEPEGAAASITINEHEIEGKTSQQARLLISLPGRNEPLTVRLFTPYMKDQGAASKQLCAKLARTIEVVLLLHSTGVDPKEGSLAYSEGSVTHDDTAPIPARRKADKKVGTTRKGSKQ